MDPITKRYDFVCYVDVTDGNPNGDLDADNRPRIDFETGHGLISDVSFKRKIRDFVRDYAGLDEAEAARRGLGIFILAPEQGGEPLNSLIAKNAAAVEEQAKGVKDQGQRMLMRQAGACATWWDVRTFGAVMTTGDKGKAGEDKFAAGTVRGPVQITFGRSVEPIVDIKATITRVAKTKVEDKDDGGAQIGHKHLVPYGLYRFHGFVNPLLAKRTGFSEDDLEMLWTAITKMFEMRRSAANGLMSVRRLVIFEHESLLGNAQAATLFDLVVAARTSDGAARSFKDWEISVNEAAVPSGVRIIDRS